MKTLKKQQQRFKEIGVAKHHRGLGNLILRYGSHRVAAENDFSREGIGSSMWSRTEE